MIYFHKFQGYMHHQAYYIYSMAGKMYFQYCYILLMCWLHRVADDVLKNKYMYLTYIPTKLYSVIWVRVFFVGTLPIFQRNRWFSWISIHTTSVYNVSIMFLCAFCAKYMYVFPNLFSLATPLYSYTGCPVWRLQIFRKFF